MNKTQGNYNAEVADLPIGVVKSYLESIPKPFYQSTRNHRITIEALKKSMWLGKARKLTYDKAKLLPIPDYMRDSVLSKAFPEHHKRG